MAAKKRNNYLDFFKGLACFGVVFFHVKMPNYYVDGVIQAMFRFAVPLFFMVSGFYCVINGQDNVNQKMAHKIKHIFIINVVGCFYYFVFQVMIALFGNSHGSMADLIERIQMMFGPKSLIEWFVFNQDPFIKILWFTFALLYCYIIMWAVAKWNLYKVFFCLIPVLLSIHYVLGNVLYLFGVETELFLYRNFLLMGIPFFMLGHLIWQKQEWLKERLSVKSSQLCVLGGAVLSVIEWLIFSRQEIFIGSIITAVGMVVLSIHCSECKEKSIWTVIGNKYSLFIYVTHVSVEVILERFVGEQLYNFEVLYEGYSFIKVFLVFGISLIGGMFFYKGLEWLKSRGVK